jgi:uncharacterized protein (DUF1778 family)
VPTKYPRINVVVTDRQYRVLTELAALQGRSASSFIREMIDVTLPLLEATLTPLRAAKEAAERQPEEARRILDEAFSLPDGEDDAQPSLLQLIGHVTGHRRAGSDGAGGPEPQRSEDRPTGTAVSGKRGKK